MTPDIMLTSALTNPTLFGGTFAAPSFWTWRTIAKLLDDVVLTEPREIELFEQCTGRTYNREARRPVRRLILLAGRRAHSGVATTGRTEVGGRSRPPPFGGLIRTGASDGPGENANEKM